MCRCYYDIVDDNYKKNVSSFGESYIIKENNNTLKSYKVNREIINSDE